MSETMKVVDGKVEVTNIRHITKEELEVQIMALEANVTSSQAELDEKKALMEQL